MRRAYLTLRAQPHYRREAFAQGLARLGFTTTGVPRGTFEPTDLLVLWNRYGPWDRMASQVEHAGGQVLVVENGLMGRDVQGGPWYSLALGITAAGGGSLPEPQTERTAEQHLGVRFGTLRHGGREVIVLEQRGIGPPNIASPPGWTEKTYRDVAQRCGSAARIRYHPGEKPSIPLERDLAHARSVVTWASGAAIRALAAGIPCIYGLPSWIAAGAGTPLTADPALFDAPRLDECARAAAFRQVARSTWTVPEIQSGEAIQAAISARPFTRSRTTPEAASSAGR